MLSQKHWHLKKIDLGEVGGRGSGRGKWGEGVWKGFQLGRLYNFGIFRPCSPIYLDYPNIFFFSLFLLCWNSHGVFWSLEAYWRRGWNIEMGIRLLLKGCFFFIIIYFFFRLGEKWVLWSAGLKREMQLIKIIFKGKENVLIWCLLRLLKVLIN